MPRSPLPRALRGLLLGLVLSALNLAGAFLAITALGGLGAWTPTQFVGMFGLLELATGLAFIVGPNIWRLPVAEANTPHRTPVQLAASTLLILHWAAGAKALAGLVLLGVSASRDGIGPATVGVPVLALALVVFVLALSLVVARLGVARPDRDVVFLTIRRPGHKDHALPGISIGASLLQVLLNLGPYPAVKVLGPDTLFQPVLGPAPDVLGWTLAVTAVLVGAAVLAWWGRLTWHAPQEQQREAEAEQVA
jgi:hypothetical protein